jgi:hypothetical protein
MEESSRWERIGGRGDCERVEGTKTDGSGTQTASLETRLGLFSLK